MKKLTANFLGLTIVFLFFAYYVKFTDFQFLAFFMHIHVLLLIFISNRIVFYYLSNFIRNKSILNAIEALALSIFFFIQIFYYALVIIGLRSWGKVITEELLLSYLAQSSNLLDALGHSRNLFLISGFISYCALYCLILKLNKFKSQINFDYLIQNLKISAVLNRFLIFSVLFFSTYYLHQYFITSYLPISEPIQLTLFGGKPIIDKPEDKHKIIFNNSFDLNENEARESYRKQELSEYRNIVLIVVDALRPDHMGLYGYNRNTTPYLSSLSANKQLVFFDNVHATCGESACGLASISSARFAHQLSSDPFTLPQVLQRNGYEIRMILGGDHTNFYNLRRLYGKVDSYFDGSMIKNGYLNDDSFVLEQTKALSNWNGKPTMFQFHLMSTHTLGKRLAVYPQFTPTESYGGRRTGSEKQEFTNFYDNGVLQADLMIKDILTELKSKNYLKNTLIVITADHGESLGEHGMFSHANSVFETLLHIPLIFVNANNIQQHLLNKNKFTSQISIAPTILQELNLTAPSSWTGLSLSANSDNYAFFQLYPYYGLYSKEQNGKIWKYWIDTKTSEEFVFDLLLDPKETKNQFIVLPRSLTERWREAVLNTKIKHIEK